jgi:hypothetical protein
MELNLWSLIYLAYRVAPLMIVIYFIFASIINQDFKGLVYLVGLIFACFVVHFAGSSAPADWLLYDVNFNSPVCNSFSIGQNGYYSNKFPFSIVVFSYTFFYIFYVIYQYGLINSNIPFLVLFPSLILFDVIWNKLYKCANFTGMSFSFIFGSFIGYSWASLIDYTGLVNLKYMSGGVSNETCQMAAQTQFKCTLRQLT